jgi:hypothetical protein
MRYGRKDAAGPEACAPEGNLPGEGEWGLGYAASKGFKRTGESAW